MTQTLFTMNTKPTNKKSEKVFSKAKDESSLLPSKFYTLSMMDDGAKIPTLADRMSLYNKYMGVSLPLPLSTWGLDTQLGYYFEPCHVYGPFILRHNNTKCLCTCLILTFYVCFSCVCLNSHIKLCF